MTTLAALYARVSTLQQEQEATIDSQVAALEEYAHQQGYQVSKELYYLDQAVSGAQLDRPALNRLRDLAAAGLFGVVLCLSPDRLARQYAHQWVLLNELQRCGVQVIFINHPQLDDSPQQQLLLGIQGLFAEYERAMITERLRRGKLYRIQQGQLVNPVAPYGYRYVPVSEPGGGQWQLNPLEATVVQEIYEWYTQGDLTIWQIVKRLNELGPAAPPRGQAWQFSTVQSILKQADYTGQAYYNRTRPCHEAIGQPRQIGRGRKRTPRRLPRAKEEWLPVQVPPIIAPEIWQRAQEQLSMHKQFASRNNGQHFYLLRGLLVCDCCGHTLVGRTAHGRKTYYCSHGGYRRSPDVPVHTRVLAAEQVEPLVWQAVVDLLANPRLLADAWQSHAEALNIAPSEAHRLNQRAKTLDRQWLRLLDLFQDEQIDKAELTRRKRRLDQEQQSIQHRLNQFADQLHQQQAQAQMLHDFTCYCQRIQAGLDNPTPQLQQEVIRLLIDHVVVGLDEIVIKHIVPTDDDCRLLPGHRCSQITSNFR